MIRRLQITLRPSEALSALVSLHGFVDDETVAPGTSAATHAFGARMGQEVARAFEAHARSLDVLGGCLDWLERRGLARVERSRARGAPKLCAWQRPTELRVEVRPLTRDVFAEAGEPDSPARATAWALRMVLRHLASSGLHACDVRSGSERVPAAEALASYDAALSAVGYGANAPAPVRLAHLAPRGKRRDDVVEEPVATPAPAPKPAEKVAAKVAPKPAEKVSAKVAPKPAEKVNAKPVEKPAERVNAKATPRSSAATGFGGLPDDAVPEDRRSGEVYSARGLTLDAEFFLVEATIAAWPCDVKALERGRRLVVSKLHPDRAGEASTSAFHRAIKGHAELLKKLSAMPAPPSPSVESSTTAAAASVTATAATSATVTTATATASVTATATTSATVASATESVVRERKRRPRAKPAEAAATVTPAATVTAPPVAPVASGSTFEWPPKPPVTASASASVRPPPMPAPEVAPEPAQNAATTAVAGTAPRSTKRSSKRVAAAAKYTPELDFSPRHAV